MKRDVIVMTVCFVLLGLFVAGLFFLWWHEKEDCEKGGGTLVRGAELYGMNLVCVSQRR